MLDIKSFNENHLDFFQELENVGVSHAATALSVMLDREISIRVPKVQLCEYGEISKILNGPENIVAALLIEISVDINGYILLVLNKNDAVSLTQSLLGGMQESEDNELTTFNEMQISALKEASNILIGSYITAISTLTGLTIDASVPELVVDMAGSVMDLIATTYGQHGDAALFLETEFIDKVDSIYGHFFLIPDLKSYKTLLDKMGI